MLKKRTHHKPQEPDEKPIDPERRGVIRKQIFASLLIFLLLLAGTTVFVLYGKGYRFGINQGQPKLAKTGILAAKSIPEGAQVFINGNLTAATNENINLTPGEYTVKIYKEGYFPWEKKLRIEKEVVTRANALLFPNAPKLESITTIGVTNPVIDPSRTKIAYRVASQSARRNGVYVFDMVVPILSLQSSSRQIADDTLDLFSQAELAWSPDGLEILASISAQARLSNYLLNGNAMNENPRNVTAILESLQLQWQSEKQEKDLARLNGQKKELRKIITDNFRVLDWSPDETKILYVASRSGELPLVIKPRMIGINLLTEDRVLEEGKAYVYDTKEDTNNKVLDSPPEECKQTGDACQLPISWFPDSIHLIFVNNKRIDIMEYDSSNQTTVYAGPFTEPYVFPWPNGSQLVILTNLNNPQIAPNLYTLSLK